VERWATFDCYGTVVDWRAGIHTELARLFGEDRAGVLLAQYYVLEPEAQHSGALSYRDVLARTLAAVAEVAGVEVPPGEEDALGASLPGWPVFPDARAGLDEAKSRGWKLAFLSNTDRDLIDSSVAAIGVEFDRLVVASEIGSYKPAHRHWEVFFERSGADRARHVHVAQSLFHDIAPANELGIPSIWINRLGEAAGPEPTRELPDLTALADCLDELVPS
jgi:2-haloacid dehalogenase